MHGLSIPQRRTRCRCWDGSGQTPPQLHGESVPARANSAEHLRGEISGPRNGVDECPRPCTPLPSHLAPTPRLSGNIRTTGSEALDYSRSSILEVQEQAWPGIGCPLLHERRSAIPVPRAVHDLTRRLLRHTPADYQALAVGLRPESA